MEDISYIEAPINKAGERRKFLRISATFVVSYYIYPSEAKKIDMTLTHNISLGGICFSADRDFAMGTILNVSLKLPKIDRLIVFLGKVVYINNQKDRPSLYDIGLKFVEAEEQDLFILENIIKACKSSRPKEKVKK